MHIHVCMYICVYIYIYIYTRICICIYIYICVHIHISIYVHVCIHVYIYIYIYIYSLLFQLFSVSLQDFKITSRIFQELLQASADDMIPMPCGEAELCLLRVYSFLLSTIFQEFARTSPEFTIF